jgi:predicted  nucleic acid-binding Zn-ribbon protein|tara:strand:+ start:206 stop:421 length:216 start_codon:yes stop_codon:yes gene_type:complete
MVMAKWTLDKGADEISDTTRFSQLQDEIRALQSKNSRQRNDIARLNQSLERVTKDKMSLLSDIKFLRGETQ